MFRYVLFGGNNFYPEGGWHDQILASDNLSGLIEFANNRLEHPVVYSVILDWAHIIDMQTMEIVWNQNYE